MQMKLYDIRKNQLDMTQAQMAEYLDISTLTYRQKEKGVAEFTQDEMFAIANLVGKSMDDIFLPRKHQNGDKVGWD